MCIYRCIKGRDVKYTSHRKLELGKFDKRYRRTTHVWKYNGSQVALIICSLNRRAL